MASPLRIECVGGLYHMTSKGNAHEDIYADDDDRIFFYNDCKQPAPGMTVIAMPIT